MRNLLYLFVFAALLLGLSACSSYYYSMLNSNDPVGEKNERGDFVQENDTVRISYRFWGENAPVTITIYNKLDEPLYVDWGRSALIIDDVATTDDPKVASVRGECSNVASGSSFHWSDRSSSGWSYSEGSFSGDVSLPKGVEFIPPHSKLVNTPLDVYKRQECEQEVFRYLETNPFIHQKKYMSLCGCSRSKASLDLRRLVEEGKLRWEKLGTSHLYYKVEEPVSGETNPK